MEWPREIPNRGHPRVIETNEILGPRDDARAQALVVTVNSDEPMKFDALPTR